MSRSRSAWPGPPADLHIRRHAVAAQPLELARNNFTLAERYDEMVAARLTRALDTNSETPAQWDDAIADADAGSDASSVGTGAWAVHIGPGGPEEGLSDDD